jgi:hypothetical protein
MFYVLYPFLTYLVTLPRICQIIRQSVKTQFRKDSEKSCGVRRNLRYCPGVCLEGRRKIKEYRSQVSRSLSQDQNPGPPEYEAVMLPTSGDSYNNHSDYDTSSSI